MGKKRSFLGFLVTLFMVFATANSFAAGYTCPNLQQYTECNSGYFMTDVNHLEPCLLNQPTCEWNGNVQTNNYCLSCQYAPNGAIACPGGTDAPVYQISLNTTTDTLFYSNSAGFCSNATECKKDSSTVITNITNITNLPTKSGYVFRGFYTSLTGGSLVAYANGNILANAATLSGPQIWYAQFTNCTAGYYCDGSTPTAQQECPAGSYCPMNSSEPKSCPDGWTSDSGAKSAEECYKTFTLNKNGASFTEWSDQGSQYVTVTNTADTGNATIKVYNNSSARLAIPQAASQPDYYTLTGGVGDSASCTGAGEPSAESNVEWEAAIFEIATRMTDGATLYLCKTPNKIIISYDMNNNTGGETPGSVTCDANTPRCMTDAIKVDTSSPSSATWPGQEFANWSCTTGTGSQCGDNGVVSNISALVNLLKSGSATVTLKANTTPCEAGYYCPADAQKTQCLRGWTSDSGAKSAEECYKTFILNKNGASFTNTEWSGSQHVTVTNTAGAGDATIKVYNNSNATLVIPQAASQPEYYTLTGGVGNSASCTGTTTAIFRIISTMENGSTLYLCRTPNTITISYNTNGATGGTPDTTTQTCEYGADCTVAGRGTMEKANMVFQGWDYNTVRYTPGTNIKSLVTDLVWGKNATIELVANWQTPTCSATNGTATLSSVTDNKPVCTITCDSGYTQGGASDTTTEFTITGNSGDTNVHGTCKVSIFTCTTGKTHDNKECPAGKYCPGGNVQYGTQDSDTGCARPCPTDENGGSVSSASGSTQASACKTTRTNIELKDGNTITGSGTTICSYNNTSKKYDAGCNTTVDSCVARYFYDSTGSSAICIPTYLGYYSPNGDKSQYSCQDLSGGNDTTNTENRGSIVTDCFNTCATITETENHLTKIPVADKVFASASGEIAECSYTVKCDAGYNNTQNTNTCTPNTIVVILDDNNDSTPNSTVYLLYDVAWYNDQKLKERLNSITLPTSEAQTCSGYEYQGKQIVDSNGKFINNTFATSGPVTITATWGDKPTVTCKPGQYYTGTGTSCTQCPGGSYCSGGTFYQDEGRRGIEVCPSAATTGTIAATNSNSESLPVTISSDANASLISQCYATNVAYKSASQQATGGQTCYYSNGKYDSKCTNQTVYVCTGGYYLKNSTDTDCVAVGDGYFSVFPTERNNCPSADGITGKTGTEIATSIAQCYTEGVWYKPDVNTGLRRTCYHTTADATTQGYITQCAIQNIVACNAGYYDDNEKTQTNPVTGEQDRICAVVPQNAYSTGIPAADYASSSRPTVANDTTKAFSCPDNGVTDDSGATSAKMCYKTDADCSGTVANATTATGTCYYSAESETIGAGYTNCTASACTVTECADNYLVSSDGKSCYIDPNTCPAGYYCDENGRHECPDGFDNSITGENDAPEQCFAICETPCVEPESCPDLLNKCKYNTSTTFSGRQYYGSNECIVTSDTQCKLDFNTDSSNRCNLGYYMFSNTDPYCKACDTLNDWIGSTMYPQTYNPTYGRGPTACYASVEPSCNFADSPLFDLNGIPTGERKNYCPENATCTEGVKPNAAYVWYPSNIGIPSSFCKLNYTCNPGYVSNSTGPVDYWYKKSTTTGQLSAAKITAACNPDTFAITLDDTGGTGGAGTIYQTYKTGWFADSNGSTQLSTPLPIPTIQYWTFSGYYEAPVGGNSNTQVIDANGNFVNNDPTASSKYTADTTLYAWWERNETQCQVGMFYTGTDAVHDVCKKDTYCTGNGTTKMGEPGCFATCPDGGLTDTTGKTLITDCYKIYNEGDTDADGKDFDIPNGTGYKKCYFVVDGTSGTYGRCTTTITSCSAGYYVSTDAPNTCSKVGSGQYSPEGDTAIYNCATNDKYKLGSNDPHGEQTDCYTICDTAIPTVSFSESVTVAPGSETQGSNADGIYDACLYNVVCKTGYDNTNGATPACNAHQYTITLDYNGGTGTIANTVQCTFNSGICELPDTATLTKTGYVPVAQWCTRPDGTGKCYAAGQNTATNISEDASDITLYAQWTPGIFKITLSTPSVDGLTPENNVQGPVYLKYESGWFADADARTELSYITDLGTSLPELTGYVFGGYELNGTTIVDATGAMQSSALTVVNNSTQTATAIWGEGRIICQPGTYYPGTGNECVACTKNWYCDKETTVTTNSGEAGRTQCPQDGTTATTGANTASLCYKTGMEYITKFDNNQPRAKGTQTCFFETIGYTNCNYSGFGDSVNIKWCAGGYWHESGIDCVAVGANYFSPVAELSKTQCPDSGNTNGTTTSDSITDCIKEMPYESGTKNAQGTCDRYADENGTYNSACIDNSIEITWCAGGHWYDAAQSTKDCVAVGANHFSPVADMTKYPCPNNGTTSLTTAETPVNVCSRSVPYPGANYNGPQVNGSGIQSCYYAGDEMAQYDDGYINNCGTIVIKQCDTGYYWAKTEDSNSTDTICIPVSVGYYGPVTTQNSTNQTSRAQCPMDTETGVRGTTETALSGDASACYVMNKACTSNGATGKTTCNYNDADKDYNDCDAYECVLEGCPAGTQLNPQNNTCDECDEGSYCVGGDQPAASCADAGDRYTLSYAGTTSGGLCYDNCQIADIAHAITVNGIIYRNGDSTCAATSCDSGYYVADGKCVECPAGSYCDPDVENGEPQTCPSTHPNSDTTQATSRDMCYAECTTDDLANTTSVAGKNYYGASVADTCVAVTCDAGYYVANGKCVECPAGSYCDPDVENGEPQTCPNGYTSDTGTAYNQDMCYQNCTTDDISNSIAVNGKDFYGASIADTCVATTCDAGYYVENGKCVECTSGSYCDPDVENGEPQTCPSTHPYSDTTQATSKDMCYAECTTDDLANSTSVAGKNYYGASVADTCVAITCDAGYYMANGKCVECPAGSYCDTNKNDGQPIKCPTSHPNAPAQSTSVYECYAVCPRIDNALEQIERDYYDDMGQNTCRATTCQDGYYLTADGLCLACAENKYCDANGVHDCPATHPHSISGQNFDIAQCYKTCSAYDIVNGQAKPVSDKVGYPEDCEYYGESTTGNPCDIITIDNKQVCTETSCNYNFELVNGACQPCNREHALSYKHNGNCVVETCATGYHPNGQSCESDTIGCSAPNAESAIQTWIPHANAFGECRITECMAGYHLADNVCQIDTETCRLPHGIGTREWDTQANAWGACVATQCDPGYTSDPSLTNELKTNEHWVQCGRCNNMYNDGELAASSYIQECEIGTCMYQGELYELRNNECNLICDEYCDDTGCRIWNERTGRCEHQCTGGYMPWNDAHGYTAHRN